MAELFMDTVSEKSITLELDEAGAMLLLASLKANVAMAREAGADGVLTDEEAKRLVNASEEMYGRVNTLLAVHTKLKAGLDADGD